MEFQNEKWEVVEHSWSDTSIYNQDGKTICTMSIDDEGTTEENQDEKENEVSQIFKLISCAPEMLQQLKTLYSFYEELAMKINSDDFNEEFRSKWNPIMSGTEELIKKATTE